MKKLLMLFCCLLPAVLQAQVITTVAGTGIAGYSGDNGAATIAELKKSNSLVFDGVGNMYICDGGNNVVRKVSTAGIITTIAGNGISGFSGDGGAATAAKIHGIDGIAIDATGNLYVSCGGDHRIRKISTSGIITTIAGTGMYGYNGDNIPATTAKLAFPYVGDVDASGNVYFSDYSNHRVRKIDPLGIITTVAGNGTNGYTGDNGAATAATLGGPVDLFISTTGEIYVPDNTFKCVRKISTTGIITTFAGTGIAGYSGDGGPATLATLTYPNSVTFDNSGNVYIADNAAYVVRKVNSAGIISTIAGTGLPGYNGDGIAATTAQLYNPNGVAVNGAGNVFIAEVVNHRIRKITYHPEAVNDINNILQHVSIYPNPVHDEITVAWEGGTVKAGNEVAIVNIAGQAVISECHTGSSVSLHIGKLSAGVYIVTVNGAYAGRFVKE